MTKDVSSLEERIAVSVIVPVYNAEKTLERCIQSLLAQTLMDIEIILVDDGSTDASAQICDRFTGKKINTIHQKNNGVSSARNIGMAMAKGEYIGFVYSDDYIDENMYATLYEIAKVNNIDIVNSNYYQVEGDNITIGITNIEKDNVLQLRYIQDEIFSKINTSKILYFAWRNIYRRSIIEKYSIKWLDGMLGEESPFNMRFLLHAQTFYSVNQAFYYYVKTAGSLTNQLYRPRLMEQLENLYDAKRTIYAEYSIEKHLQDLYVYTLLHTLPMLIGNIMNAPADVKRILLIKGVLNSAMVSESLKKTSIGSLSCSLKKKLIVFLIKYKLYSLLFLWR